MKRAGRVWIRVFPDVPVTAKPTEVRMGKGKGSVEYWACKVKPGRIMFEIDGVSEELAREALRLGCCQALGQDALRSAHCRVRSKAHESRRRSRL